MKTMKVKDVLALLAEHKPEDNVYVYSQIDEGGDCVNKILSADEAKEELYFKGDAPWDEEDDSFVVIA